jgi:hypothetical protein
VLDVGFTPGWGGYQKLHQTPHWVLGQVPKLIIAIFKKIKYLVLIYNSAYQKSNTQLLYKSTVLKKNFKN